MSAPTVLGSTTGTTSGTSQSLSGITAAGTLVIVTGQFSGAGTVTGCAVSDSAGNSWTTYSQATPTTGNYAFVAYSILTSALFSGTITVTRSGSGNINAFCMSAVSAAGYGLEDAGVFAAAQGTSNSPSVTGNAASQSGDLLIAVCGVNENAADTYTGDTANGWTNLFNLSAGTTSHSQMGAAYQVNSGTAGITHNPSLSASRSWAELQIAFKASGGTTVSGSGSASGAATVSGTGGAATAASGAAAGAASASGAGGVISATAGSAAGLGAASGAGSGIAAATGGAAAQASVSGTGGTFVSGAGTATATAAVAGCGGAIISAQGQAAGAAAVSGSGPSGATVSGSGAATGQAVVSGTGGAVAAASGSALGTATVTGIGQDVEPGAYLMAVPRKTAATAIQRARVAASAPARATAVIAASRITSARAVARPNTSARAGV